MTQPVIIKLYCSLYPVKKEEYDELVAIGKEAMPCENVHVSLKDGLLLISFEGIFYPVEDTVLVLEKYLNNAQKGKLDMLDLEEWSLNRHVIENNQINAHTVPLNHVLDYSGH